jgi:hypothetical protein
MACAHSNAGPGAQPGASFHRHYDNALVLFDDLDCIREKSQDSLRQPVEAAGKLTGDKSDMAAARRKFERHCTGNFVCRRQCRGG